MRYFKITNLLQMGGIANYRGLDIDQFIPGSQFYYEENNNMTALIATNENTQLNDADVSELTEQQYLALKNQKIQEQEERAQTLDQRLAALEQDNLTTLEACAELYELLLASGLVE